MEEELKLNQYLKPKTLHNSDTEDASKNTSDVKVFGNPDIWELICKASSDSQGWMKSTKRMAQAEGWLYQVTTQQRNPDGSYTIAEALAFVPDDSDR